MTRSEYRFEGYALDTGSGKLFSPEGSPLALSSRAFSVLRVLVTQQDQILAKTTLMDAAWPDVIVEENNLNQAISQIRKVLGDSKSEGRFIQTIPGRGYRFSAPVTVHHAETDNAAALSTDAEQSSPTLVDESIPPARRRWPPRTALLLTLAAIASLLLYFTLPQGGGGTASLASAQVDGRNASVVVEDRFADAEVINDSIAVLPFTLLNSSADSELFAFGLHDEIINQLSRIRGLKVIARNSVATLTRDQPSVAEIGQRLGVQAAITGSILFQDEQGDRARISLRMLEPASGVILWASTYEAQTGDLAALVSLYRDIALNAAGTLDVPVSAEERQALGALPTASFAAYRYYLAANAAYYALDYPSAWNLSKQAITLDPHYYDALYTYASVNTVLIGAPLADMDSRQHHAMALEAAQRMIEVAPRRTEGHALKASVHSTRREWLEVAASMEKLHALNASLSDMRFLAPVLLCLGDFSGAIDILEANLRVEPVNLYARGFLMMAHELAGNRMQARQEYELGETLTPLWWGDTVEVFLALGRRETLRNIGEQYGLSEELSGLLHAVNSGDSDWIHPQLLHYSQRKRSDASEALFYAAIAAHEGYQDLALVLARQALEESWLTLHWLWLPVFDEIRPLPGFQELLRESGLPAYWEKKGWPAMCQAQGDSFHCDWKAYP